MMAEFFVFLKLLMGGEIFSANEFKWGAKQSLDA